MTKREGVDDKELEFERIALVHLDTIFNAALRLTGHTSDAEDPVQETFLPISGRQQLSGVVI